MASVSFFVQWGDDEGCAEVDPDGTFADVLTQACERFGVQATCAGLRHEGRNVPGHDKLCESEIEPGAKLELVRRAPAVVYAKFNANGDEVLGPYTLTSSTREYNDSNANGTEYTLVLRKDGCKIETYSGADLVSPWGEHESGYSSATLFKKNNKYCIRLHSIKNCTDEVRFLSRAAAPAQVSRRPPPIPSSLLPVPPRRTTSVRSRGTARAPPVPSRGRSRGAPVVHTTRTRAPVPLESRPAWQ